MNFIIFQFLWATPHVLLIPLAVIMIYRGLHREFPIFFSYVLFEFLLFCILFAMAHAFRLHFRLISPEIYAKIDPFGRAGTVALHFGIFQELFESPVAGSPPLRQAMARILNWATLIIVVLAVIFFGVLNYNTLDHRLNPPYRTIETLNAAQCGLIVLIFLWYRFLRLRMLPFVVGIAVGMGLVASMESLMAYWLDSPAVRLSSIPGVLQMASFQIAVLVWIYFALVRESKSASGIPPLPDLRQWAADLGKVPHL